MENKTIGAQFKSLSGNVKEYVALRLELFKLNATEKIALVLTHLIISVIILFLITLVIVFLSIAFILWYGYAVGPAYVGALIIVGVDILAGVLIYLFRYPLFINPLVSNMSNIILEESEDEED